MSDDKLGTVKVGYLQTLSEKDRKATQALHEHISALIDEKIGKMVDPTTRPTFSFKDGPSGDEFGRFAHYAPETKSGGFLPPMELTDNERYDVMKTALEGGFNINMFPRGDIDNFSVTRWAMANERANNTSEGGSAYHKWAPWETAYYGACEKLALANKAMGDMVSGQDGGGSRAA